MQANTSFDLSDFIEKLTSPESVQDRKKERKAKVTEVQREKCMQHRQKWKDKYHPGIKTFWMQE